MKLASRHARLTRSLSFRIVLGLSAVVATTAVACGGSVENPQTSANAATKAPVGTNTHGLVKVVGDALGDVPLRPDQRTELEKLAQAAETRHAPMAAGRKELVTTLADQIEKGSIDRAALQPKIDRVAADIEQTRGEDRAAVARLHAILDTSQRGAFVDAIEKNFKAKHGDHPGIAAMMKLKALADDLKLTDDQRSQIKDALKDLHKEHGRDGRDGREARDGEGRGGGGGGEKHEKHGRRGGFGGKHGGHEGGHGFASFRDDDWDIDKAVPAQDVKARAAEGTTRFVGVAEKILPILTPEQRKIAADKIRAHAEIGDLPLLH